MENTTMTYNRAKIWQMAFFAMNNTATNLFMFFMMSISYYATGVAGLGLVAVSAVITGMRMFDGITDPIIGYIIDRTDGKFGKFRPMMLIGYVILTISTLLLVHTVHLVPEGSRMIYFIFIHAIYVIGYTFQTACTKGGQACITNDPKQRPTFSLYDGIFNTILFAVVPLFVYNSLVPKHTIVDAAGEVTLSGLNNLAFHQEFLTIMIIAAGIMTTLAMIGISGKDKKEFFGLGEQSEKVALKDYLDVVKNNRAIQTLILAASTDKLASSTMRSSAVGIVIFGVVGANTTFFGTLGMITMIPSVLVLAVGIMYARKLGQKQALVFFTWAAIAAALVMSAMVWFGPMDTISIESPNFFTLALILVYILIMGFQNVSGSITIPMIADCADYETYRSRRYIPGMMGTLFSFVDKMISSLATTIVGLSFASIGFVDSLPTFESAYSTELKAIGLFLFMGMPILGWLASLIGMRYYPLTAEKMAEIQSTIAEIKANSGAPVEVATVAESTETE